VTARPRGLALAVMACGVLMLALPTLPWFAADLPTGRVDLSGYGVGGVAWILPAIGAALVGTGLLVAWWRPPPGTRQARFLGGTVVVLAALGVLWGALVTLWPRIGVVAQRAGRPDAPIGGEWSVSALPGAWACLAAAAVAGMAGILLITPGADPPGRA
jgi:hypothetical protein